MSSLRPAAVLLLALTGGCLRSVDACDGQGGTCLCTVGRAPAVNMSGISLTGPYLVCCQS